MAAVTVSSDFGTQENKICHCFPIFPFYLPWSDGTRCHESESESHSVMSDSLWPHVQSMELSRPEYWSGYPFPSQGFFPTQGSNPGLPHCWRILYQLIHKGSPRILGWVAYPFSSGSSWPRNWTEVSCIGGGFFTNWAVREGDKGSQQLWDTSHDPVLDVQGGQWILHKLSTRG